MRSAISSVPGGKFRLKTQAEQQIWQDSARLIARAINYYNTLLISHVAERQREAANAEPLEFLKCVSPVAWRHITLIGSFDFTASSALIDLEALAARFYLFGAMGSNSQF